MLKIVKVSSVCVFFSNWTYFRVLLLLFQNHLKMQKPVFEVSIQHILQIITL